MLVEGVISDVPEDCVGGDAFNLLEIFLCGAEKLWSAHVGAVGGPVVSSGGVLVLERFGGLLLWSQKVDVGG